MLHSSPRQAKLWAIRRTCQVQGLQKLFGSSSRIPLLPARYLESLCRQKPAL